MITQSSDHSSPQNGAVNTFNSLRSISLSPDTQTLWFATSSGLRLTSPVFFFFSMMMTVVSSSLTTSLFIISRTVCSVRNTTKKTKLFSFCCFEKINNQEHTHAPQLCVVTFFFFDFGTESRRLWGRSTSKTKEINKRWIVVELSFYWRSYSTTTRLFIYIYISMWWWYLDMCTYVYIPSWCIYMCQWLPAIKLSVRREGGGAKKRNKQQQQQQDNIRTKRLDGASIPSIRDAAQSLCRGMLGAGGYIIFIRCVLKPYTTHVYTVV